MSAPVSIIVPTLNAAPHLPACFEALMEGVMTGMVRELIISDGGSQDQTLELADLAGAEIVTGPASRGGQLRRGAEMAQGEWLLIVHADTVLDAGWSDVVGDHLRNQDTAAYFPLAFDARGVMPGLVAGWANLRARRFGVPYGDQGLLVSRLAYTRAGGYPDQPLMEDVALVRALEGAPVALDGRAVTSAARYQKAGWLRQGARNQWRMLRYMAGVSPERLAKGYRA